MNDDDPSAEVLSAAVKLVVWDLDDTFWQGTLSEGPVVLDPVLVGLVLNAALGWWWADPLAGYVLLYYAVREARDALAH